MQLFRSVYLQMQEMEPMLQKSQGDIEKEFNEERIMQFMDLLQEELNSLKELKTEEV